MKKNKERQSNTIISSDKLPTGAQVIKNSQNATPKYKLSLSSIPEYIDPEIKIEQMIIIGKFKQYEFRAFGKTQEKQIDKLILHDMKIKNHQYVLSLATHIEFNFCEFDDDYFVAARAESIVFNNCKNTPILKNLYGVTSITIIGIDSVKIDNLPDLKDVRLINSNIILGGVRYFGTESVISG